MSSGAFFMPVPALSGQECLHGDVGGDDQDQDSEAAFEGLVRDPGADPACREGGGHRGNREGCRDGPVDLQITQVCGEAGGRS